MEARVAGVDPMRDRVDQQVARGARQSRARRGPQHADHILPAPEHRLEDGVHLSDPQFTCAVALPGWAIVSAHTRHIIAAVTRSHSPSTPTLAVTAALLLASIAVAG